jgi:ATP-dependent Zn protease
MLVAMSVARALEIVAKNRAVLDKGAELLLKREKIDGAELKTLMAEA